jgi:hypothetical protein
MTPLLLLAMFSTCGLERQAVKTLHDPAAKKIPFRVQTPFPEVLLDAVPPKYHRANKRHPIENQVVRLEGYITGYMVEDDGDYHVIFEPRNVDYGEGKPATMILEFPSPVCIRGAWWEGRMLRALERFDRLVPKIPTTEIYWLETKIGSKLLGFPSLIRSIIRKGSLRMELNFIRS